MSSTPQTVMNNISEISSSSTASTSTPKNIQNSCSNTNFVDTETESNLLFGNVSDVEYNKLCVETDVSSSSNYTDTFISKYVIQIL